MKDEDRRQAKRDCKFSDEPRNWRARVAGMLLDARQARYGAMTNRRHRVLLVNCCRIDLTCAWTLRVFSTESRRAPLP